MEVFFFFKSMMQFAASPNAVFSRSEHGAVRIVLSLTRVGAFAERSGCWN